MRNIKFRDSVINMKLFNFIITKYSENDIIHTHHVNFWSIPNKLVIRFVGSFIRGCSEKIPHRCSSIPCRLDEPWLVNVLVVRLVSSRTATASRITLVLLLFLHSIPRADRFPLYSSEQCSSIVCISNTGILFSWTEPICSTNWVWI